VHFEREKKSGDNELDIFVIFITHIHSQHNPILEPKHGINQTIRRGDIAI